MFVCRVRNALSLLAILAAFAGAGSSGPVLTNCRQVVELSAQPTGEARFDIRATVTAADDGDNSNIIPRASVEDDSGAISFSSGIRKVLALQPGDTAHFEGAVIRNQYEEAIVTISNITDVVHGPAPTPREVSFEELKSGRFDDRLVRTSGVVRYLVADDIDPNWEFLVLAKANQILYVARRVNGSQRPTSKDLLGATVAVTGVCEHNRHSPTRPPYRRIERQILAVTGDIQTVRPADTDFARAPALGTLAYRLPESIALDRRFRTSGRVLAVWNGDSALLRTPEGPVVRAQLADGALPDVGTSVDVLGFPEYNLFTLGLTGCLWHKASPVAVSEPAPTNITVRALLEDKAGHAKANVRIHGRTIRIEGLVHSARGEGLDRRMVLAADGYLVPVDAGACPQVLGDIPVGSRISVSGVCVMNIDDWRPNAPFPRVRGFAVILRAPDDICILSRPPWWTPARLTTLVFSILAVLCFSVILNIVFKRLVEKRSRQLEREIGARVESDCKVRERTRLAVELHDAISPNLPGVAFQLQPVKNSAGDMPAVASKHLDVAERTLGSCRDELRNCLWDLRNNTLDCADMNEAIRQTLAPHLGDARLVVRFDVARTRFADNFAHALLHIIRELATNAVRHGHATQIRIAGCIDRGRLLFSVADNGRGFDPRRCPGFEEGHFGLLGVRERIEGFEGELTVESGPAGTKVTASMATTSDTEFRETT